MSPTLLEHFCRSNSILYLLIIIIIIARFLSSHSVRLHLVSSVLFFPPQNLLDFSGLAAPLCKARRARAPRVEEGWTQGYTANSLRPRQILTPINPSPDNCTLSNQSNLSLLTSQSGLTFQHGMEFSNSIVYSLCPGIKLITIIIMSLPCFSAVSQG